jgi:hypothetical protein
MPAESEEWFETSTIEGRDVRHVSKFLRPGFKVSVGLVASLWGSWSLDQRRSFAVAFSARAELDDADQKLLDFLMEADDSSVWRAIAILVTKHRDHDRAVSFLMRRVADGEKPLSNYYQALGMMAPTECFPILSEALSRHRKEVDLRASLHDWGDRFIYLDYLSCSAVLFKITGLEEYNANLKEMLKHPDETIRNMVRVVADSTGISV